MSMISFFMLDERVYHLTYATEKSAREVWRIVTDLGDSGWMAIGLILIWILAMVMARFQPESPRWKPLSRQAIFVFVAVALPGIFTLFVKGIVGRARPYLFDTEGPFGFNSGSFESIYASWPSGHTTTAFAFAIAVILMSSRLKYILLPLAALAGYSRMALGAHYLADVIMGATVGTIGAILIYQWLAPKLKL